MDYEEDMVDYDELSPLSTSNVDNTNILDDDNMVDDINRTDINNNHINNTVINDTENIIQPVGDNTPLSSSINLELGDIIEIISPTNSILHEHTFYIIYIDTLTIKLINVASLTHHQLNILENGSLSDESIQQINLLNRSDIKGYARQNNLLPNTWVNIHLGGDIPTVITGEITKLDEDMIEIITYPDLTTIYIDFQYKGIPQNIPIEKITIREKPITIKSNVSLEKLQNKEFKEDEEEEATILFNDSGEAIIDIPEGSAEKPNIRDTLHELYTDANAIIFTDIAEPIYRMVEVPEHEQRYSIDEQVNDMMDELLSNIPNINRTQKVLDNIHNLIIKFKYLRQHFSQFDNNNNINGIKKSGPYSKPLIDCISKFNMNMKWIIPVVGNQQKIYDTDGSYESIDVIHDTYRENMSMIEDIQTNYYKSNDNTSIDYNHMVKDVNELSIQISLPVLQEDCITVSPVLTGIDAITDNLNDFYSSVYEKSGITRRKYVVHRYNMDKISTVLNKPDPICVKSFITLPQQIIQLSAVNLPSTSLINRATLHSNYILLYKLFNKHTEIIPHIINDLSKEYDFEQYENDTNTKFLEGIHEFILDKELYYADNNKFHQFLETILPKTKMILKLFRKYIKHQFSLVNVVQQLEPFMIYTSDISYKQFMDIRYFIKESIKEYKINMAKKSADFAIFRNTKHKVEQIPNMIIRVLTEQKEFADMFYQTYTFLNKDKNNRINYSSQEILLRMLKSDNCLLYTDLISSILSTLVVPKNIIDVITKPNIEDLTEIEQIKPQDCSKRVLSKIYTSINELQKDNNKDEIYVDAELDDTPYNILKNYKNEQKQMMPEIFFEFLVENLIQKHDCPKEIAKDMAKTLISKKKVVLDGYYARLEIKPELIDPTIIKNKTDEELVKYEAEIRKKIQYFRRLKNNWVKDDEINDETFLDTSAIFCNIDNKCMKNLSNSVCENTSDTIYRFKKNNINNMKTEFGRRIDTSMDEIQKSLEIQLAYHIKLINKNEILREINLTRANNLAYTIGQRVNVSDVIISPHLKLRNLILGQNDFVKKQHDICKFVALFCREPITHSLEESTYMLYCKDTNVKLFPISLFQLATTFVAGGDYRRKLNEICANPNIASISDDGDSIIDKNCGFVLRKRDFSIEEEYDELGHIITSHDILEQDLGNATVVNIMDKSHKKKSEIIFENEISETIYNIANAVCSNIDIPIIGIYENILRISNELIHTEILSESSYQRKSDKQLKKTGKHLGTYDKYRNETIILIVASVLIIMIQTATPSFKTNKTYPGCIRSFSGYPMDGIEDITGIKYIACVLYKLKSSIVPWDSIQSRKPEKLTEMIKSILENQVMKRNDMNELYIRKREFNLLNPTLFIPFEHSVSKWTNFLPPIVDYNIEKTLQPVAPNYHKDVMDLLKKNNKMDVLHMLIGRIIRYGYGIIETINNIVKNKELLLKTASDIPFLENACCNENSHIMTPISYFIEQDNTIKINIQSAQYISIIINNIRNITHAPFLFHPFITRTRVINVATGYTDETIYRAFIHYCNFDKNLPVPEILQSICNTKPDMYNSKMSIYEKIEIMKKNGNKYNEQSVQHLMTIINKQNIVNTNDSTVPNNIFAFKNMIDQLDRSDSNIISDPLRVLLYKLIDNYKPDSMHDTSPPELDELQNYLITSNQILFKNIINFLNENGKSLTNEEFNKIHHFLSNISDWKNDQNTDGIYDTSFYSVVQYLQNAIQMISKTYPILLINNSKIFKKVPKHWGLSSFHVSDIENSINKYYANIEKFKGDNILLKLLNEAVINFIDLNLFVKHIPIQSDIIKQIKQEDGTIKNVHFFSLFNKNTIYLLLTHCLYLILYQYALFCEDNELLHHDININKQNRREEILKSKNVSDNIHAIRTNTNEELNILDDNLQEIEIILGNKSTLKQRVCSLLISFLDIEQKNKEQTDFNYQDVMSKVNRVKEREKKSIVEYFGQKDKYERGIEFMLKEFRIGRWNVGQQKGLVSYDKNTYDRERFELTQQTNLDINADEFNVVTEMRRDIFDIEQDENEENDQDEQDELRIDLLGENFMDGEYYEEDQTDNF